MTDCCRLTSRVSFIPSKLFYVRKLSKFRGKFFTSYPNCTDLHSTEIIILFVTALIGIDSINKWGRTEQSCTNIFERQLKSNISFYNYYVFQAKTVFHWHRVHWVYVTQYIQHRHSSQGESYTKHYHTHTHTQTHTQTRTHIQTQTHLFLTALLIRVIEVSKMCNIQ